MFSHLKKDFENKLPIIQREGTFYNEKTESLEINLFSNESFHKFLASKTAIILSEINTMSLYQDGQISDIQKLKLELLLNERRTKLESQALKSMCENPDYIEFIKDWFKDEKAFIEELTPLINNTKQKSPKIKRLSAKFYALYHRLLIEIEDTEPFELVNDTELPKKLIEGCGIKSYGFDDGQSFYREYRKINTMPTHEIAIAFGKGYKEKLIKLSNNNAKIIKLLKKYPN